MNNHRMTRIFALCAAALFCIAADSRCGQSAEVQVDAKILNNYAGQYRFGPGAEPITVGRTDEGLTLKAPGKPEFHLIPRSEIEFFLKGAPQIAVSFKRSQTGNVTHLVVREAGRDASAERIPEATSASAPNASGKRSADANRPPAAAAGPERPFAEYVDFLKKQRQGPAEYILGLFERYDMVVLCERAHPETTQYDLIYAVLSDPRFQERAGHVFTEVGIALQEGGPVYGLNNRWVADTIELTSAQRKEAALIQEELGRLLDEAVKRSQKATVDRRANMADLERTIAELRKDAATKAAQLLTSKQKEAFERLKTPSKWGSE